jgi:hypothetical protein
MNAPLRDDSDPLAPHSLSATELKELLKAERAGRPFLAFRDELGLLCVFALPDEERTTSLGRRAEMDLAITWDAEVSGLHAELQVRGGELTIADDGLSTNGTYVNGQRIGGRHRLRDGDRVRTGRTILVYKTAAAMPAMETVSAADTPDLLRLTEMQRRVLVELCRPFREGVTFATPATNQEIASTVFLSVDGVKMHLRALFAKFELTELPQNQKRAKLAEYAMQLGVVSQRDLA